MTFFRKILIACLCLCLLGGSVPAAQAAEETNPQRLLGAYCANDSGKIESCLDALEAENPAEGALWRRIMTDWARLNEAGFEDHRVLPDDLTQWSSAMVWVRTALYSRSWKTGCMWR